MGAVSLIVACFLFLRIPETISQIDPQKGTYAAEFAEKALDQFPKNAIILTSSDLDSFPLWAYHLGYGWRKDVSIIVLPLTRFEWYRQTLIRTYPSLKTPIGAQSLSSTTNWEDQIGPMNADRILCESEIITQDTIEINFQCSNGQIIHLEP